MSFDDFRNIGSSRERLYRNEKFDFKENNRPCEFMISIKASGSPNAKALKWFVIALGVLVSAALVIGLVVFFVVFTGHGHNNDGTEIRETTQKDTQTTSSLVQSITSATVTGNGTWSNWGPWTMCAVTCGNSIHSRYRTCIKNTLYDAKCVDSFKEEKECTTTPCPVYGTWTTWQSWSNCDASCGGGTQNRLRTCDKVQNTDIDCVGRSTQQQTCNEWACPDCSRVCTTGTLNSVCDACECSTNVQGLVRNQNGGLLNNASVAHESAPYRELTFTNENGTFELNNACNQNNIILKRSGYQDTTVKITSPSVTVTLQLIQYPVITTQPKSHLRLEGESVEFCCNATGNPAITSYEWLKNGNLLNESFYPGDTTLILTDLKFADSGKVVCRANSPAGAIYSDAVSLSVRVNPDDFCSDAYGPHEINLPSDCVQPDTNSVKYDIGKCSPNPCRKNNSNEEQSCSVDKKYCCISSGRERRIIQCTGYSFPLYITTSCSCGECEDSVITLSGQAVGATSGLPLRFGSVEIDGNSVGTTGFMGDFSFTVPKGTSRIAVTFKDTFFNQFLDTLKIIRLNEGLIGRFTVHVSMIEKSNPINIHTNVSNTLQLGDQDGANSIASLTIPPNSIFYPNGTRYNGAVSASINFFDPRNSSSMQNAPGEFVSIDQEGQTQNLQSFGVFSLSLQDQSGSSLQIAGETEIKLDQTFFGSTSIGNITDAKLWGLNPYTGIWEEQGTLSVVNSGRKKRQTTYLVGTIIISEYNWINMDVRYPWVDCLFKTEVYDGNAQIWNYNVRIIYWTRSGSSVIGSGENFLVSGDQALKAICRTGEPLKGYIAVQKDGKNIPVDRNFSGLISSAESFIGYDVLEDGRTVSSDVRISEDGPFSYATIPNFANIFRFKTVNNDYSYKLVERSFGEIMQNPPLPEGNEIWYPPLYAYDERFGLKFRSCFIKIGTEDANSNLVFRVTSKNENNITTGIHEKYLTNGAACIEYRCSVSNPDLTSTTGTDFVRDPITYTSVRIIPIGQVCKVSNESSPLRNSEQNVMKFSEPRTNKDNLYFDAYLPEIQPTGIYFDESRNIEQARQNAFKKCNRGVTTTGSDTMVPNKGLATIFKCTTSNAEDKTSTTEVTTEGTSVIPGLETSTQFLKLNDGTTTLPNIEDKTSATEGPTEETSIIPAYEASTPFSTTNSSDGYSFKLLNPSMEEAVLNSYPGNEVWYPPLNSFQQNAVEYKTCFIKIGTVNANNNLLFRVTSINDDSTLLGIHGKGLTDGTTCIEYRCSVRNPDFTRFEANDFYRYPVTYTLVHIIPIGQICNVSGESSSLRTQEQSNMGLSSRPSNIGNIIFEANIPDTENEGIFFHRSNTFNGIPEARNTAIRECNRGVHDSFSDDMFPNVGLATTFTCI